jgi:hypothetical protein
MVVHDVGAKYPLVEDDDVIQTLAAGQMRPGNRDLKTASGVPFRRTPSRVAPAQSVGIGPQIIRGTSLISTAYDASAKHLAILARPLPHLDTSHDF